MHLTELDIVGKLFALGLIAFFLAYKVGIYLDSLKSIPVKKHGRKTYSFFKFGLNALAKTLNNNDLENFKHYCNFLSCT